MQMSASGSHQAVFRPRPLLWIAVFLLARSLWAEPSGEPPSDVIWIVDARVVELGGSALADAADGESPIRSVDVRVENGRITDVIDTRRAKRTVGRIVDAAGGFLLPGFIDTHAHIGLGPVSFQMVDGAPVMKMAPDPEVPRRSLLSLLAHGVTPFGIQAGPASCCSICGTSPARQTSRDLGCEWPVRSSIARSFRD